jgi:hypothetical protein
METPSTPSGQAYNKIMQNSKLFFLLSLFIFQNDFRGGNNHHESLLFQLNNSQSDRNSFSD